MDVMKIIAALLLFGIGLFAAIYPEEAAYLQGFGKYRDAEPSEANVRWTRYGGIGMMIAAVLFTIFVFVF